MSGDSRRPADFVETVRERTRKYLHELNEENGALRQRVEVLECERTLLQGKATSLEAELFDQRAEQSKLLARLDAMERLRHASLAEYALIEEENNNLASLYSATYSLHGTLDRERLLGVIQEIVVNLIGSEEFGVLECNEDGGLRLVAAVGLEGRSLQDRVPHSGVIAHTVRTGSMYLDGVGEPAVAPDPAESGLTACAPLTIEDETIGAIAIFGLLKQKPRLTPVDHELLALLGCQAGIALHAARLHSRHGGSTKG